MVIAKCGSRQHAHITNTQVEIANVVTTRISARRHIKLRSNRNNKNKQRVMNRQKEYRQKDYSQQKDYHNKQITTRKSGNNTGRGYFILLFVSSYLSRDNINGEQMPLIENSEALPTDR